MAAEIVFDERQEVVYNIANISKLGFTKDCCTSCPSFTDDSTDDRIEDSSHSFKRGNIHRDLTKLRISFCNDLKYKRVSFSEC